MPTCRTCHQPVETWQAWFEGLCDPKDPLTGHRLLWDEVKALPGWKGAMSAKRSGIIAEEKEEAK